MTKQEAIQLEKDCENFIKDNLEEDGFVEVSMTLTGRLSVRLNDNKICFNPNNNWKTEYVSWNGDYRDLKLTQKKIKHLIREFSSDFEKLIWSYEHRTELED